MKTTKKSFLTSLTALILCFVMLLGTTFAWFTDSVTSTGNKIVAGDLDIELEMIDKSDKQTWINISENANPIFNYSKWEPGFTDVTILKVVNKGSLALKWQARFVSNNEVSDLAKVIDVYVKPGQEAYPADKNEIFASWQNVGTLDQFINTLSSTTYGSLVKGESAYLGIALKMQESAGNEYKNAKISAFDIQIVATQLSSEEDSFGSDYDNNAEWPAGKMNFSTKYQIDDAIIVNGELIREIVIRHEQTGAYAVIPAGVKVKEGVTELEFSGKDLDNQSGNVTDSAKSYDIHIEGIADDNTKCITVYIGKILDAGLGETELKLYHEDVQMTRVNSVADFAINNQYTYDPETGAVVLYIDNFSVFTGFEVTTSKWTADTKADTSWYNESKTEFELKDVADFLGFRDLVDSGVTFENKTVKLTVDIELGGEAHNFNPIGYGYNTYFSGTFDGQKHTIYGLYENGWDLGYSYGTQGGGLFASVKNATIKNLAISGATIVMECVDMGILVGYAYGNCEFNNIVITNSVIANYNRYTGGVVGEVGGDADNSSVQGLHKFIDVTVDSTVKISALWGTFDPSIGGVIGGKYGNALVEMTDVVVACELDVYSDVTSAYQWYAYRRCGMLIGLTEESKKAETGTTYASASFLTCNNVKVYYGNWIYYTYCEFEHTNNPGYKYPWVRVQESDYNSAYSNPRYGHPIDFEGNTVTNSTHKHAPGEGCTVSIPFNQLYGGGQGVYGQVEHSNVKTYQPDELTKKIYFNNVDGWSKVYLYYWYEHTTTDGGKKVVHSWNNLAFPGESMKHVTGNIYEFEVPIYAKGIVFNNGTQLSDANHKQSIDIDVEQLTDGYIYWSAGFSTEDRLEISANKYTNGYATYDIYILGIDNNWNVQDKYKLTPSSDGKTLTATITVENQSDIKLFNKLVVSGNGWITANGTTNNTTLAPGKYKITYYVGYNNFSYEMTERKIFFNPWEWNKDGAWFQAWTWGGSKADAWISFTDSDKDGIFEAFIPSDRTGMKLVRKGPSHSANNWDKWNETGDISIPTNGNNLFTITHWSGGSWSTK